MWIGKKKQKMYTKTPEQTRLASSGDISYAVSFPVLTLLAETN